MASIISVDTLKDSAGSNEITTANVKTAFDDRVKVWVNFNGTGTISARDSLNLSSLTDNGAGDYTINFTNNFANTGYCLVGSCAYITSTGQPSVGHNKNTTTKDVSHDDIYTIYQQSVVDPTFVEVAFFGDLA